MKTKQNWLVWLAPLVAAVPLALTNCGGSTSTPGVGSGLDAGEDTSLSGSSSGSATSGTTSTSGTVATSGAGGSGSTSGAGGTGATSGAGGTGATSGAATTGATSGAGGTGATSGAATTGASSGTATSGAADPCTDGTYKCNAAQKCDPTLGCVECLTNANCPPGGAGNANLKVCVLGNCAVCGADTDCPTGDVCYPSNHTCHASCLADGGAACGGGRTPICDMTTGACVGCLTADDCKNTAGRAVCDATTQQCVQCQADADCKGNAAGAVCDTASATCVQCEANSDCPTARPVCDADFHTCVAGCTTDAQCLARSRLTPVCDTTTGRCEAEPPCTSNADCSADGGGATPFCEAPRCVECIVTSDCPGTGRTCANGMCR
jgi:hypothetical protein